MVLSLTTDPGAKGQMITKWILPNNNQIFPPAIYFPWCFVMVIKKLIEISFYSAMEIFSVCEIQPRYQNRPNLRLGWNFTTYYIYNIHHTAAAFSFGKLGPTGDFMVLFCFSAQSQLGLLDHCCWSWPLSSCYWSHCWGLGQTFVMGKWWVCPLAGLINSTWGLKVLQSATSATPREY